MSDLSIRELNRRVVARYWEEFWTKGNVDIVDELCWEDYTLFYPLHGQIIGRGAVKNMLQDFKKVFLSLICCYVVFTNDVAFIGISGYLLQASLPHAAYR
jgi:hypothetical protein